MMPHSTDRFRFIDVSRILGIALMYYGHTIESPMKTGNETAAMHYKFIYSFHMPLFFILSGYLASTALDSKGWSLFLRKQALSRLLPYALFTGLLLLPTLIFPSQSVGLDLTTVDGYTKGLLATFVGGFPMFNIPTWFLICIFVVELLHYGCRRFLLTRISTVGLCLSIYVVGSVSAWYATWLNPLNMLGPNGLILPYFMLLEALTGYAFYLFGLILKDLGFFRHFETTVRQFGLMFVCLFLVVYLYDLNQGMFTLPTYDAVVMAGSSHGNPILFPITAILGSVAVMIAGRLLSGSQVLQFLGANTLVIFALNGAFYHFTNDPLARWIHPYLAADGILVFVYGVLVSGLSLGLTIPVFIVCNRWIPQLIGRPGTEGPILPRLVDKAP